jgi:hypothetical protein
MSPLFDIWHSIQHTLSPWLEKELDPLTEKQQEFIRVIELEEVQRHMSPYRWQGVGRKRGRPRQGEIIAAKKPKRPDLQLGRGLTENMADLPTRCDVGTKINAKGYKTSWIGYKLHIDSIDGDIPVSALLSSASLHDSQAAIPLAQRTAERITCLYDLMDSAYDAPQIRSYSAGLGHVPIIDTNPRRGEKKEMDPAQAVRFRNRTTAERVNSNLKDNYGGRFVRLRGAAKVMMHLMFGLIAITAT